MSEEKTVVVVPVREGSTRIKDKNFQPFLKDKSLIHRKIKQLKDSKCFDEIYISSNSDRVREISEEVGAIYIEREAYYCGSEARWDEVVVHILESVPGNPHVGWAMVTSPLFERYNDAVKEYFDSLHEGFDSLIGAKVLNEYLIDEECRPLFYGFGPWHPYTTEFKSMYAISDVFFIARKDLQLICRYWFGRKPKLFLSNQIESVDVNFPDDLTAAKAFANMENG